MTNKKQVKTFLPRTASKRSAIPPFVAMDVLARANGRERAGHNVIHMEVGQPSTPAPSCVLEAAQRVLTEDRLGYTEAVGIPALREKIAAHYVQTYGVEIAPSRIVVTTGSSAGFILAFLAALEKGGKVAIASPGYPCYRHILSGLGNVPVILETDAASRFAPSAQELEGACVAQNLDAVLIASPANPTGTMLSAERLEQLISVSDRQNIWFISDEIYHGLTYETPARTALEFSDNAIVINSFSKYFSMTGWRVGWMIVPEVLVRTVERLQQNLFISAPTLSQLASIAAFDAKATLEGYRAAYQKNRDVLLEELASAGFNQIAPADGAFYLYVDISSLSNDSEAFAAKLLDDTGVAVTPGCDFDERRGGRYIRLSYAGAYEDMVEAARRIRTWLTVR